MEHLSFEERRRLVAIYYQHHLHGTRNRFKRLVEIAAKEQIKITDISAHDILKKWLETGSVVDEPTKSRTVIRSKITEQQLAQIDQAIYEDRRITAAQLKERFNLQLSVRSIQKNLRRLNWKKFNAIFYRVNQPDENYSTDEEEEDNRAIRNLYNNTTSTSSAHLKEIKVEPNDNVGIGSEYEEHDTATTARHDLIKPYIVQYTAKLVALQSAQELDDHVSLLRMLIDTDPAEVRYLRNQMFQLSARRLEGDSAASIIGQCDKNSSSAAAEINSNVRPPVKKIKRLIIIRK